MGEVVANDREVEERKEREAGKEKQKEEREGQEEK
jgi:hypothetical protein